MVEEFKLKKLISPPLLPLLSKNQRIRGAPVELAGAPKNLVHVRVKLKGFGSKVVVNPESFEEMW